MNILYTKEYLRRFKGSFIKLGVILKQLAHRRFDPNYLQDLINGGNIWYDPYRIQLWELGKQNKNTTIGFIKFPNDWSKTAGFFALLNRMLCGLSFADRLGIKPVMDNWNGCPYQEDHEINGTNIVFEYYFNPLSNISVDEALHSRNVVLISNPNMDIVLLQNNSEWFHLSDSYIKEMGKLYGKYVRLNDITNECLVNDLGTLGMSFDSDEYLGIHFRGSDYRLNMNGHPISLEVEDYYPIIDRAMKKGCFKKIFFATDDSNALSKIKGRYKNVVCFQDTQRTNGEVSVAFVKSNEKNHKYRLGYEVLRDSYALASCGGLIAGYSQVAVGARINKASQGKKYKFIKIIDKGINRNNREWMTYFDENMKKEDIEEQ